VALLGLLAVVTKPDQQVLGLARMTPPAIAPAPAPAAAPAEPEKDEAATTVPAEPRATAPPFGDGVAFEAVLEDPRAPLPARFVLSGFGVGDSSPRGAEMEATADRVAAILKRIPGARVRIDGFTDDRGSPEVNRNVSLERAMRFRGWLLDRGVAPEAVAITGRGGAQPLASNRTEDGRAQNRRIEIVATRR